jgi:hypothetical protein
VAAVRWRERGVRDCVGDLPLSMRTAGQGIHVLPLKCSRMCARQEDLAVVEIDTDVVGIVECAANQPVGVALT